MATVRQKKLARLVLAHASYKSNLQRRQKFTSLFLALFKIALLSVICARFGSSLSAAKAGVGRCPLDRFVLNDRCEKSSHEARLRWYYMLRQGKHSS